ncbi:Hypothetical protein ORPV_492 [Orpheovirus IHUMI-LCC2]|uniref:Uncharacterized protein n=1 Tax=Orpheovirus IHUMI-LCC2 TaxID=2023057 RepID=A0A2I2L4D1_9VIRU|nr:Hypothetical protein ORPV_492 [Orpheovirus IHUMI-LCC2]SNW62396.1 Hypothetical protein ORPV_492 [Orpheovirus IHUMI-LCC2]
MFPIKNQDGVLLYVNDEFYNNLLCRVDIFRLDEEIVINDIFCGSADNTIIAINGLIQLNNIMTCDAFNPSREDLIYILKLLDGLCMEPNNKERPRLKSYMYKYNLELEYGKLFIYKDFIKTKTIPVKINNSGNYYYEEWTKQINNIFLYKEYLIYEVNQRLYLQNINTGDKKILIGKNELNFCASHHFRIIEYYIVNNQLYIHIFSSNLYHLSHKSYKLYGNRLYKENISLSWLRLLYNNVNGMWMCPVKYLSDDYPSIMGSSFIDDTNRYMWNFSGWYGTNINLQINKLPFTIKKNDKDMIKSVSVDVNMHQIRIDKNVMWVNKHHNQVFTGEQIGNISHITIYQYI